MEFGPILAALTRHKTGTILVALQIAVSLSIVVNAASMVHFWTSKIDGPTGMDTHNMIAAQVRGVSANYDSLANVTRDLDMLRQLPGVKSATIINQVPLSSSGSSTGIRTVPDENATPVTTAIWQTDQYGVRTLGVNLVQGRDFYPDEVQVVIPGKTKPVSPKVVIVTQALADKLFPGGDALGKTFYWSGDKPCTIVGIVNRMAGAWPDWEGFQRNLIEPRITAGQRVTYLIRTAAGRRDRLIPVIQQQLAKLNPDRVIRYVRAEDDIIKRTFDLDRSMVHILIAFITLLLGLTTLVIVGLVSWFVSQRTKQIGTRRALGATRGDILRYFLVENWLITTLGAIGGCIFTVIVGYWLSTSFELPRLDWRYLAASVFALWLISLFAAYWPARRAAAVSPAVATRTV